MKMPKISQKTIDEVREIGEYWGTVRYRALLNVKGELYVAGLSRDDELRIEPWRFASDDVFMSRAKAEAWVAMYKQMAKDPETIRLINLYLSIKDEE